MKGDKISMKDIWFDWDEEEKAAKAEKKANSKHIGRKILLVILLDTIE